MSDSMRTLIAQNKETRAASLDLSGCDRTVLPREIAELDWLEELALPASTHRLDLLEDSPGAQRASSRVRAMRLSLDPLEALPKLRSLILSGEELPGIARLPELTTVTVREGRAPDLRPLTKLAKLRRLTLDGVTVGHHGDLERLTWLDALTIHHGTQAMVDAVSSLHQLRELSLEWIDQLLRRSEEIPLSLSALRGLAALESLRLCGWNIQSLTDIRHLHSLRRLSANVTKIGDLEPLRELRELRMISLASTLVANLSPLKNLTALQSLWASETGIKDLTPLRDLGALQMLDLERTFVSDLSPLSELTGLEFLDVSGTAITSLAPLKNLHALDDLNVSRTPISALVGLEGAVELRELDMSRTNVRDLTPLRNSAGLLVLNASSTQVADLSPLQGLTSLRALNIASTKVADLTPLSGSSALQKLNIWRTEVADLSPLRLCTQLHSLNASSTRVSDLTPLRNRIEEGMPVLSTDNYKPPGIFVYNCPLTSPPAEIVDRGAEAILSYFQERDKAGGVDHLYEAKVLVIGDGGAGKTSLVRRLYRPDQPLPGESETTRGIDIHRHDFILKNGRRFRLNIWDFGGQEIYHATHQFFLTRRSLYVLVDDTRTSDKSVSDPRFKYWLELVELFGGRSPTLIFQNEKGGRSKQIDLAGIRGEYENVKECYRGNLEQPGSVDSLRDAIEFFAGTLDHVGDELPASWLKVRADIETRAEECPYISQQEYFDIYRRHMEFDRTRALHLSRYLHDLGVFLHFQADPLLSRTVILQNHWATEAVFRVLDDEIVKGARGRFTPVDCNRLWQDAHYADMHPELLALMQSFELCYELPDSRQPAWLAPQMLSPGKPQALNDWSRSDDLVLGYHYEFLPKGIISRLTVRLNRFVRDPEKAWVTGVLFERENTAVLVELLANGKDVQLRARGADRKALLSVIAADLDALNASFEGLRDRVSKRIPCVCCRCCGTHTPEFFDERKLMRRKEDRRLKVECPASYEEVSVLELLDGVRVHEPAPGWGDRNVATASAPATITIFLASSAELRTDRDEFELYFRQLNDRLRSEGRYLKIVRWENFLDAMSETRLQDEYNKAVASCDVFVSLFFTKTGKFTQEEFDVAHRRFAAEGKPAIYTFFKNADIKTGSMPMADLQSLHTFKEKLQRLGHFHTSYDNIEHLKRQFRDQLDRLMR